MLSSCNCYEKRNGVCGLTAYAVFMYGGVNMERITYEDFLKKLELYSEEEVCQIKKAYQYADELHKGQTRQSGEPYIIHPLNVAYILADMHADCDTICAGLLHDTLEDTEFTKEDIADIFNKDVANLVDGVTKISKLNFSN